MYNDFVSSNKLPIILTGNKHYKLANLVRASTATPFFFEPEMLPIIEGEPHGLFVDGVATPHNNPALMMFLMTPVTNEKTILRFAFTHKKYLEGSYEYKAVKELMLEKLGSHGNLNGVHADIPIWNNKIYRKHPLLCDGDGPIMQYRSWFKQFYDGGHTN